MSNSSDDEAEPSRTPPSHSIPEPVHTNKGKKRMNTSTVQLSNAKRLRVVTDEEQTENNSQIDIQDIMGYIRETNSTVQLLKKKSEQARVVSDRQEKFLKMLCTNQKRIAKGLTRRKVRISV